MNLEHLKQRADLIERLRRFFKGQGFLEVETPTALDEVIPEAHIEPIRLAGRYLQASPELAMKKLLCGGSGSIFQIGKCYRDGECGPLHAPEFTMVEWYGVGGSLEDAMVFTESLSHELLGTPPAKSTTYRDAFLRHVGIDPHRTSIDELRAVASEKGVTPPETLGDDRDEWLNLLLSLGVEPHLGRDSPELLTHYPASQAALAKTVRDPSGAEVAERFELYYRGVELANGYHELTDPIEMRRRLEEANATREANGRRALPMPESLLAAMQSPGLPESSGVALGFDRLVMLAVGAERIADVMAAADHGAG